MANATITGTASNFGSISGVLAGEAGTVAGTITGTVSGTLTGSVGVPGAGVPSGGTTGQVLKKVSNTDYDTTWGTDLASAAWGTITGTLSSQTDLQTALNLKADLASPALTGNPTAPTAATGDNDTTIATTGFVQQELAAGTAVAKNLEVYVRNQTGATLTAGTIVYIDGATGNRPTVTKAQANNDANSAQTFGFVKASIANNGFGYVIVRGELENVDTSALTEGQQLYLSPTTAGTWTTTKPSAPQHLVYVGIVVRAHPTQGIILVAIQNGYELEEIHDVKITSPSNGQVLKYDSAQGLWVNGTDSSGVAWGGITGTLSAQTDLQTALDAKATAADFLSKAGNLSGLADLATARSNLGLGTMATETASNYLTTATASTTYAPLASPALTGNVTITTNSTSPALVITQDGTGDVVQFKDVTSDTTYTFIDQNGKVNTVASTTTSAGFNVPHGTAPTSPVNGDIWTTTGNLWVRINGASQAVALQGNSAQLSSNNIFTNASSTYGNSTATGTINVATGATISGSTKTLNIGTGGVAGSTTNIAIGSTTGTSTTTLQGTTNGVTVAADTNSTALATTAYVVGQAGSATPLVDGTAAVGTSLRYARQDHVHPTDTSRAPLASPALTGTPTAPTAAVDTNTTQLATTAYVIGQGYLKSATASSTYAPLASPALTGTPTAPTASAGTNTTQIATTAFVQGEGFLTAPTVAETLNPTLSTKAVSLNRARYLLATPNLVSLAHINHTNVSGSGTVVAGSGSTYYRDMYINSLATGRAAFYYGLPSSAGNFISQYTQYARIDWSKPIVIAGNTRFGESGFEGDANCMFRISLGGYTAPTTGNMTIRGVGIKKVGGTGSAIVLTVHDGTTLTDVATTVTVTPTNGVNWVIDSDGTGTVNLYIDNTLRATTNAGPKTQSLNNHNLYREQVEATATPTVKCNMGCSGGWIYITR